VSPTVIPYPSHEGEQSMTTYKINPRDIPGLPRTWTVIKISDDGNTVEELAEYKTESEAKAVLHYLEYGDEVDEFSDWHTWKGNKPE
jgi:hypothetical protein